jgi:predicted transport protein
MPLFEVSKSTVKPIRAADFRSEKELQRLVEQNLGPIFNCRFVATEFATGARHAGRIDTLALSEDDNPVIIEYKLTESATLINQGLFYLSWLDDHHGDFELAAREALGSKVTVDWEEIRVLCIAPSFTKYDLHAVQSIDRRIELWTYQRFENGILQLEPAFGGAPSDVLARGNGKNPVMVSAGKKAAETRARGGWTFKGHLEDKPESIQEIVQAVQEFMTGLDEAIEESPKKLYIAYRTTQNIVCVEPQNKKVTLFLKLDPKKTPGPPGMSRDVTEIGHYGTGDLEITVKSLEDLELAKPYLKQAYEEVGG